MSSPFQLHSVYRTAMTRKVSESHEYRESFQLLGHLTAVELRNKMEDVVKAMQTKGEFEI